MRVQLAGHEPPPALPAPDLPARGPGRATFLQQRDVRSRHGHVVRSRDGPPYPVDEPTEVRGGDVDTVSNLGDEREGLTDAPIVHVLIHGERGD